MFSRIDKEELIEKCLIFIGSMLLRALFIMLLWNWILPNITNLSSINYLQSIEVDLLCALLIRNSPKQH